MKKRKNLTNWPITGEKVRTKKSLTEQKNKHNQEKYEEYSP